MNYYDFYEKLSPFFTDEQIDRMNHFALESAQDAISEPNECFLWNSGGHDMGREFVCTLLWDMMGDDDPAESIQSICGGVVSARTIKCLEEQMDVEW